MIIEGRPYSLLMGSDVSGDGMYLELYEGTASNGSPIADCYYSDKDGSLSVKTYTPNISDAALAWLRSEGARRLPPSDRTV
jgi:hypothetical protein